MRDITFIHNKIRLKNDPILNLSDEIQSFEFRYLKFFYEEVLTNTIYLLIKTFCIFPQTNCIYVIRTIGRPWAAENLVQLKHCNGA